MSTLKTILAALTLGSCVASAQAQLNPSIRPGEQPINTFVMKSTHNSYERSEPISEQIQKYSTFQIEFDINWRDDRGNGRGPGVVVEHFCGSPRGGQMLEDLVASINDADDGSSDRVVFIYLDKKDPNDTLSSCYDQWPANFIWVGNVVDVFKNTLGVDKIYPSLQFVQTDLMQWPSMQELNRRGYRYVLIIGADPGPGVVNHYYFVGGGDAANPDTTRPTGVLLIQENGSDSGGRDAFVQTVGPKYLNRCYSDVDLCVLMNGAYWDDSVNRGFNFVATNCVDDARTITDTRVHSPSPMYVQTTTPTGGTRQWGTLLDPMTNLYSALLRASAAVNIKVKPGTYDVPNNTPLSRPVKISADGGLVRIQ